jgi:hypothetical protein
VTGRIAVVPPRFGATVVGGSESVSRQIALGLASRDWDVEVITTRANNHLTWDNELPAGVSEEDGLVLRRFTVVREGSRVAHRAQLALQADQPVPYDEQLSWLNFHFRVPDLFHYLVREGRRYDAVLFSPYLFWTTAVCMPLVAERAVSMPCLHDESYARLDVLRPVLSDPASVWFLSEPEHRLEMFATLVRGSDLDLDLVTIGVGPVSPPDDIADRVIDLGFLSAAERDNALAAAMAYVQPSRMESFSLTIMESWLAGTPVLAVAQSEVVAWHCGRSRGGLLFTGASDLADRLRFLIDSPDEAAAMAERGRRYVLEQYTWPVVLDRMEADLKSIATR